MGHDALHGPRELVRAHVVDRASSLDARQACIRAHDHGTTREARQRLGDGDQLVRAERAVHAHGVGAQRRQRDGCDFRRGAQKGAAVFAERHRGEHGKRAVLLGRQHGRLGLPQIGHGLDDDQVAPRIGGRPHLLGEQGVCLFEGKRAPRLQKRARGTDVAGHVPGACRAGALRGGAVRLGHRRTSGQLAGVRAERVRRDHFRTASTYAQWMAVTAWGSSMFRRSGKAPSSTRPRSCSMVPMPPSCTRMSWPRRTCSRWSSLTTSPAKESCSMVMQRPFAFPKRRDSRVPRRLPAQPTGPGPQPTRDPPLPCSLERRHVRTRYVGLIHGVDMQSARTMGLKVDQLRAGILDARPMQVVGRVRVFRHKLDQGGRQ